MFGDLWREEPMRVALAWWSVLLAVGAVCAVPVNPPGSADAPDSLDHSLRSDAQTYAANLANAVATIQEAYVRKVTAEDLYEAALAGLYEAVRQPVPAGLRAELRESLKAVRQAVPAGLAAELPESVNTDIMGFLIRVRTGLGQPEELRGHKAVLVSLKALPRVLDPYCGLTPRQEFQRLDLTDGTLNTGLEFIGIPLIAPGPTAVPAVPSMNGSVELPPPAGALRVARVQPGGPAQKAGVRPDDLIIRLNGHPPGSTEYIAATQRLRPIQPGTKYDPAPVTLTIRRRGHAEPIEAKVRLEDYRAESVFGARRKADGTWDYMLDPAERIGYIRLGGIRNQSGAEFRDALQSLRASGVRGLIFDLRWCPGGMLDEAVVIVRLFLPERLPPMKPVYWQCDRSGKPTPWTTPTTGQLLPGWYTEFPVLVLVNGETSGGGEFIAAALQDHERAVVAGQRTVGKASIQWTPEKPIYVTVQTEQGVQPYSVPFKVTMYTFLRPSGKNLQRFPDSKWSDDWGVRPDEGRDLPLTAEAGRRLKEWWTLQTLRPPADSEALPLDDPENDPQRLAAVQMLRRLTPKSNDE
jgi:C-terminal peptidase prc